MGRGGRSSDEKVSFFAFQDIITAVIGILVLIALILALQINPKTDDPGDNPGNNTGPIEVVTGNKTGEDHHTATPDEEPEENATEIMEEIAKIEEDIDQADKNFTVFMQEKNNQLEVLEEEIARLEDTLAEIRKIAANNSPELKLLSDQIDGTEVAIETARNAVEKQEEVLEGLEDEVDTRVLHAIEEMSEDELLELSDRLSSQIEQLDQQEREGVRIIPQADNVTKKPVLVGLAADEFTIGEFNGEQTTEQVTPANYYQKLGTALTSYSPDRHFFVYFFRPSACKLPIQVRAESGIINKNLFKLLCESGKRRNLTQRLGFQYGFEPIHEDAALLFTDKQPDSFEMLFPDL